MGGVTTYTEEMALTICEELADGRSLREICRQSDRPALSTVFKWLSEQDKFSEQYARAREIGLEALAEDIIDIADNASNDYMDRFNDEGEKVGEQINSENIQRSRLRVDSRKWLLAKMLPKKYGEKVKQEISGPDDGPVEVTEIVRRVVYPDNVDS